MCLNKFSETAVEFLLWFLFLRLRPRRASCVSSAVAEPKVCVLELADAPMPVLSKGWSTRRFGVEDGCWFLSFLAALPFENFKTAIQDVWSITWADDPHRHVRCYL